MIQFEAEANPTTGYSWDVRMEGEGVFDLRRQAIPPSRNMAGAAGKEKFTLQGVSSGDVTVYFLYRRPWEGGERHVEYVYTFRINNELRAELLDTQRTFFNGEEGTDILRLISE